LNGTVLGKRYELLEVVGDGGMATVYKARCRMLDRIVAVKILKPEYSRDQSFVEKFRTEATAAARLSHPNIVNIYDVGQEDDIYYIVMEYVEGRTLKDIISEEGPLPVGKAVDIAIMICDGIHQAHQKGIIHRDIKPANILVTSNGMVKVADFGIAQAISKKTITFGENVIGSVHYISPEQAKGEPLTPATDIYSLGCVLFEMLTGQIPFDAESPITVALKHIHDELVSPSSLNPEITPSLEAIIYRAMDKVPARRFKTAEDMRNALLHLGRGQEGYGPGRHRHDRTIVMPAVSGEGGEEPLGKKKVRPYRLAIVLIAVLGLLSGVWVVLGDGLFGRDIEVPNLQGKTLKEADYLLSQSKLGSEVKHEFSDEFAKNTVIRQSPIAGTKVKQGRRVTMYLSQGPELVVVPRVEGRQLADAEIMLGNKDLSANVEEEYDDKYAAGFVISQEPGAGKKIEKGGSVNLLVSKGPQPEKVSMPDLVGLNLDEAHRKAEEKKLVLDESGRKDSTEYYANQIISQDPESGVMVDEGSTVKVVVSKGPGPVAQTVSLPIDIPADRDVYKVQVILRDSRGNQEIYNEMHPGGDNFSLGITYLGRAKAEVKLNGKPYRSFDL
jgi:beta-lactam-binding protein with PASTA domain/tRNA A-37 threonylcarbamoyl transferase component Bud32